MDPLISALRKEARALSERDKSAAIAKLVMGTKSVLSSDADYAALLRDLLDIAGDRAEIVASVALWLCDAGTLSDAIGRLANAMPKDMQASGLMMLAELQTDGRARALGYQKSGDLFLESGLLVRCALAQANLGNAHAAARAWAALSKQIDPLDDGGYPLALCYTNLAIAHAELGDEVLAGRYTVSAVHLLEEAADGFERSGERERAFDCYEVFVHLGKSRREFEHVVFGYVNLIRILKEDSLIQYALSCYGEAIDAALSMSELNAAATFAHELSEYAKSVGLLPESVTAKQREAALLTQAANEVQALELDPEGRGALIAAAMAYAELGDFGQVRELYEQLGRSSHPYAAMFAENAKRYSEAALQKKEDATSSNPIRVPLHTPVWNVDLVEWEQGGSLRAVSLHLIAQHGGAVSQTTRRRALFALLSELTELTDLTESRQPSLRPREEQLIRRMRATLPLEIYEALPVLERLFDEGTPKLKVELLRGVGRFLYKRTFRIIRRALADSDDGVVTAAAAALSQLRFPHAVDPLRRIFVSSKLPLVKQSVLSALVRIETRESASFLVELAEHEPEPVRSMVQAALKGTRNRKVLELTGQVKSGGGTG